MFGQNKYYDLKGYNSLKYMREMHVTLPMVRRLGLEAELQGHEGCVNCLDWSRRGDLLASGSDDCRIILWKPGMHHMVAALQTGHMGNIFSVNFLPYSGDCMLVSGAADCRVKVYDLTQARTLLTFGCHTHRVKRLATCPDSPHVFWSGSEDGTVRQYDLRDSNPSSTPAARNVLINLRSLLIGHPEVKCISLSPTQPELIAVGANDPCARVFDRRMLSLHGLTNLSGNGLVQNGPVVDDESEEHTHIPSEAARYFLPGHLALGRSSRQQSLAVTYLTFSPDGKDLLVNLGGEQVYLMSMVHSRPHYRFDLPPVELRAAKRRRSVSSHVNDDLPFPVENLKSLANKDFKQKNYTSAISLYNQALALEPSAAVLYCNRAAALTKRQWEGDLYAALLDCNTALRLDPSYLKAHFRLVRCLLGLGWTHEATTCLKVFNERFPDSIDSPGCVQLSKELAVRNEKPELAPRHENLSRLLGLSELEMSLQEQELRSRAQDFTARFVGHCNTTTDIKEANFLGTNGQFVVAGSDEGSFFVWDRKTCNLISVLRGDDSIVNCLQAHPFSCLLASSGIDPVVRIWSPLPENGKTNGRSISNPSQAASANQQRMKADPLELMLRNMGYRMPEGSDADGEPGPCRAS